MKISLKAENALLPDFRIALNKSAVQELVKKGKELVSTLPAAIKERNESKRLMELKKMAENYNGDFIRGGTHEDLPETDWTRMYFYWG